VLNCSTRSFERYRIGLPRQGTWRVRLNSDSPAYSDDFGAVDSYDPIAGDPGADGLPWGADIAIGPYTALILSQDS
jgi:1,4-alpha-glucan branching enzyme